MDAEWTTEYPTQPGFYWIRNYRINSRSETISRTEPTIACVLAGCGADFWLWHWPVTLYLYDIISAEWFGPIQPPEDKPQDKINTRATALGVFLGADKLDSRKEQGND